MKKVGKIFFWFLLILVTIVLVLGIIAPREMRVKESVIIHAPKKDIEQYILDFKKFEKWSPWANLDPNVQNTYEGEPMKVHHKHIWSGNEKVGKGSQEIVYISHDSIATKLIFIEPFEDKADAFFLIKPKGKNQFEISWGFVSKMNYPMNGIMWLMGFENAIRQDYKKGLETLKKIVEENKQSSSSENISEIDMPAAKYAVIEDTLKFEELGQFFANAFPKVFQYVGENQVKPASAPVAIYYFYDEQQGITHVAAGVAVSGEISSGKEIKVIELPASKALKMDYYGNYNNIGAAHYAIDNYMKKNRLKLNDVVLEEYITDPQSEPDTTKWLTKIYYRIL